MQQVESPILAAGSLNRPDLIEDRLVSSISYMFTMLIRYNLWHVFNWDFDEYPALLELQLARIVAQQLITHFARDLPPNLANSFVLRCTENVTSNYRARYPRRYADQYVIQPSPALKCAVSSIINNQALTGGMLSHFAALLVSEVRRDKSIWEPP